MQFQNMNINKLHLESKFYFSCNKSQKSIRFFQLVIWKLFWKISEFVSVLFQSINILLNSIWVKASDRYPSINIYIKVSSGISRGLKNKENFCNFSVATL